MKFVTAAVVLLAVAMGVQSSIVGGVPGLGLGLGVHGLGINGLGLGINGLGVNNLGLGVNNLGLVNGVGLGINGLGLGVNGLGLGLNGVGVHGLGVNGLAVNGLGVNGLGLGLGGQVLSQGAWLGAPAAVNVATGSLGGISVAKQAALAGPLIGHGASYVAKTRGALHTAPLAGHVNSVASVNVAPAPGTW